MASRKVIRKNFVTKGVILLFSFMLKRRYLIYEDGNRIVFLEKGKTIDISKLFKREGECEK